MAGYRNEDTANWDTEQVRRAQAERRTTQSGNRGQVTRRPKKKRTNGFLKFIIYVLAVLVISAVLAKVGWALFTDLCAFDKAYITTTVEITADDDMASVADKLEEAGLIEYPWFFRLFGVFAKAEENIGIGTHELNTDMDYRALIVGMRSSGGGNMTAETVKVTIPEGYTVSQTIALLAEKGVNTEEALLEAAQTYNFDYDFIDNNSEDISRLEGYLFPDTYEFYVGEKPSSALNRLISNFNKKIDNDLLEAAEARGYDLEEIVIIASLIEKETDGTDHSKIASVIYNRLDGEGDKGGTYGMLQVDAALLYGLEDHEGAITNEDKETDTRYNLYKYAGLPPTAIANPGLESIQAALDPAETNYYYYALGKDGKHRFFTNYSDHVNFINSSEYISN